MGVKQDVGMHTGIHYDITFKSDVTSLMMILPLTPGLLMAEFLTTSSISSRSLKSGDCKTDEKMESFIPAGS